MTISNAGLNPLDQTKQIKEVKKSRHTRLNIGAWRDGGFGDAFFSYAVLKAIKRKFPESTIEFLTPQGTFSEVFKHQDFCIHRQSTYREIYQIQRSCLNVFDIFYCLRPSTFSVINWKKIKHTDYFNQLKNSATNQKNFFGDYWEVNPEKAAGGKVWGNGAIQAIDGFNHIHCLDSNFDDAKESIENSRAFKEFENSKVFQELKNQKFVTFHQWGFVGHGTWTTKFWPYEKWQELAKKIKKELGIRIIQIGGKNEIAMNGEIENFLDKNNFLESCRLIQEAQIHVDVEGSLIHAAALLNEPAIALTGPTGKYWRHEEKECVDYIFSKPRCEIQPCEFSHGGSWNWGCPLSNHICMNEISVEQVFEKILERLK